MNTRSKMLVILMSIIGVAVLGDQGYRRFIEEPGQKREREIDRLRKQISDADDDILQSRRAKEELEDLEQFSLPSDEELARSRYQDWLLKLVEKVGIQQPSIDAGVPTPVSIKEKGTRKSRTVYQRYGFTVRGRASLDQFIEFLFEFHRAGHLHKIPNMALNPISGGNLLDIGLSIEAIGLEDVSREGELSTQSAHRLAFNDLPSYRTISRRNVFVKESDSSLRKIHLSAVTFDRTGRPEAWFTLDDGKQSRVVRRGDSLSVPKHDIEVIDITPRMALVEVDGQVVQIELGKSIAGK